MKNDMELKTHVSEQVHDDFSLLVRAYGMSNKSELLRHLIERELYGTMPRLQVTAPVVRNKGNKKG